MNILRTKDHQRNGHLEELLADVNELLASVEKTAIDKYKRFKLPLILIMGSPRSGTTLLMQWLASLGHVAYPTNILSRFFAAPYIGAKIQLMLTKHDFNNEIFDFNPAVPFSSRLGKTKGALAPNEFWYFWRRFFHFDEIQKLTDAELESVDIRTFITEIAALEAAFEKPFAMKGMIVNWNIPFMAKNLDKVLFVYTRRNPLYNAQSLLKSREDYYGDRRAWYSFKPPEYEQLKDLTPCEQVAGQIYHTNRAVEEGLAQVDDARKLFVDYEDFCNHPESVFKSIIGKFVQQGCPVSWDYDGPESFDISNRLTLPEQDVKDIIVAYRTLSGETLHP